MTKKNVDVAIVGGGLIGMMSALYLTEAGLKVAIFDKSALASESSWAGGGIISPLYPWKYAKEINALAFRSQEIYPLLSAKLEQISGINPEYYNSGMLISLADINQTAINWLRFHGIGYENVSGADYPSLVNGDDYVWLADICQVRNPILAAALESTLRKKQVAIYTDCAVTDISPSCEGNVLMASDKGQFTASKVVVSAGAWSGSILQNLGIPIDVKPIRGQMLLFKAEPGLVPAILLAEGKYIIPRKDGHVLAGSTMEDVGFNKATTQDAYDDLLNFVKLRCPVLSEKPIIKHWSGLRPGSPNGIPYIFRHPLHKNIFVNTGHFRNGVVLGPASAEMTRDLVLGSTSILDHSPYGFQQHTDSIGSAENNPIISVG